MTSSNKVVRNVGCLFPMCACIDGRLGCAHEPYDMKEPHNEKTDFELWLDEMFEGVHGG